MIDPAQLIAFALGLLIFMAVDDVFTAWASLETKDEDDDVIPGEDGHGDEPDDGDRH